MDEHATSDVKGDKHQENQEVPANDKLKMFNLINFFKFKMKKKTNKDDKGGSDEEAEGSNPASDEDDDKDDDRIQPATKEDCLKLLKESFDGYDYNGNGTVAHEEVREAWLMCQEEWNEGSDPERCDLEASIFMKDIDVTSRQKVTFEDYVVYFQHLWRMSQTKSDD